MRKNRIDVLIEIDGDVVGVLQIYGLSKGSEKFCSDAKKRAS